MAVAMPVDFFGLSRVWICGKCGIPEDSLKFYKSRLSGPHFCVDWA
jgi:hypothetical protein